MVNSLFAHLLMLGHKNKGNYHFSSLAFINCTVQALTECTKFLSSCSQVTLIIPGKSAQLFM